MVRNSNEAILQYLRQQNRPYSAVDILNNLHKEFGKTQIQKSLDQLAEDGKIAEKANGKQKVYAIIQSDVKSEDMKKELQSLDGQIGEATIKLGQAELSLHTMENKVRELNSVPTTEAAEINIAQLEEEAALTRKMVNDLATNTIKILPADKTKLIKVCDQYMAESRKRKRICMDILESILEGYPKDKKSLFEEIGIETD